MAPLIRRGAQHAGAAAFIERRIAPEHDPLDDLRLFATAWMAGLVFFGTLLS
jgi:hypothetical protein